jgi:hypothetical protein
VLLATLKSLMNFALRFKPKILNDFNAPHGKSSISRCAVRSARYGQGATQTQRVFSTVIFAGNPYFIGVSGHCPKSGWIRRAFTTYDCAVGALRAAMERENNSTNTKTKPKSKAKVSGIPDTSKPQAYARHKPGSRKSTIHQLFDSEGPETAWTRGIKMGLQLSTLRGWFAAWRRDTDAPKLKEKKQKPQTNSAAAPVMEEQLSVAAVS